MEIEPDRFIAAILDVEDAAALLVSARGAGSIEQARAAADKGRSCPQLLIQSAELIAALGDPAGARGILRGGLALDGPTAPLQHSYARHCRAANDLPEARRWLRGAMLRARANAAMALELCEVEFALGDRQAAVEMLDLAMRLRWSDPAGLQQAAERFRVAELEIFAVIPLMMLHRRGESDAAQRAWLADLFSRHAPFDAVPARIRDALRLSDPVCAVQLASASAHDRLAASFGPEVRAALVRRETSDRWISVDALWGHLRDRIEARQPFSWIRGGDGEARFLAAMRPQLHGALSAADGNAMLEDIWQNWFGSHAADIPHAELTALASQLEAAFRNADLLGVTTAAVFDYDRRHSGYRALLEKWIDALDAPGSQMYNAAGDNVFLHDRDPFFARLLRGQRFVGVISPHRDLGGRLQKLYGAAVMRDYRIPGESRLDRPEEQADRGTHFPAVFDRLMREIEVPFPGTCFLVAGGLLGKIYCDRIRTLGGIALDIGALADAWMGFNTRGRGFDRLMDNVLPA